MADKHAFTLLEMLMAVAFSAMLMAGVFSFYNAASQTYSSGITGQTLQDGVNTVLSKIIEGETEAGVVYRLSTSQTYTVANGTVTANTNSLYSCGGAPQATPCNLNAPSGELYFCQDNPQQNIPATNCNFNDSTARWYYLNNTGTSIIYHHYTSPGNPIEENIYTAPTGSGLTLRFSPVAVSGNVVMIDVALRQNLALNLTNDRLASTSGSGAASTFVLLRNHP